MELKTLSFTVESLTSPYKWHWKSRQAVYPVAEFTTNSRDTIHVNFDHQARGTYDVDFTSMKSGVFSTDDQDSFKVMATILDVVRAFINEFGQYVRWLEFTSVKDDDDGPDKRGSLYARMLTKYLPKEWKVDSRPNAAGTYFTVFRKDLEFKPESPYSK